MAVAQSALRGFLNRQRKIALDTSVFIFHIEANPKYADLVGPIFAWLEGAKAQGFTPTITMLELLVQPYRLPDIDLVNEFYALLSTYPHLEWIAPTLETADLAARLRADHNLATPDSLQAATALVSQATGFISNDPVFRRVADLEVGILDDFLAKVR